MKRKYFLRGLGIGIFVTALLFTIALLLAPPAMSDARIKKEARKLGMVEADAVEEQPLDELPVENADEATEKKVKETAEKVEEKAGAAKSSKKQADEDKKTSDENKSQEDAKKAEAEAKKEEAEAKKQQANEAKSSAEDQLEEAKKTVQSAATQSGLPSPEQTPGKEVTFVVESGQNSYTVSANLYKAGLVDDATQFDRYLEQHNYDNQVQNGTFSIKEGSTYEDIAKTLTGR